MIKNTKEALDILQKTWNGKHYVVNNNREDILVRDAIKFLYETNADSYLCRILFTKGGLNDN
jgi:hypothetical protein